VDSQQDNSDSARDETARRGTSRQRPNPTSADSPNPAAAANPTADVELSAVETTEIAKGNSTAQPTLDSATPSASVEQSPNGKIAQSLIGKSVQRGSGEGIKLQGAEQARLINRVARAMTSAREQGAPLRIRLSPPELGSIRLEVKVQDGAMSARIEAETPAARAALLENVSDLRQRLAEQGIRVEQFDVDLTDRQNGSELPENTNKETDERPQNQDGNEARNESERTTNEEQASSRPEIQGDSKLNVII
jgi:flagellar hook-length control protein FliK